MARVKRAPFASTIPSPTDRNKGMITSNWRSNRPVIEREKCTDCLLCWVSCPDACISQSEQGVQWEYDYCKGCGICAEVCPVDCIIMVAEMEFDSDVVRLTM